MVVDTTTAVWNEVLASDIAEKELEEDGEGGAVGKQRNVWCNEAREGITEVRVVRGMKAVRRVEWKYRMSGTRGGRFQQMWVPVALGMFAGGGALYKLFSQQHVQ